MNENTIVSDYQLIAATSAAMKKAYNRERVKTFPKCITEIQQSLVGCVFKADAIELMQEYVKKHG